LLYTSRTQFISTRFRRNETFHLTPYSIVIQNNAFILFLRYKKYEWNIKKAFSSTVPPVIHPVTNHNNNKHCYCLYFHETIFVVYYPHPTTTTTTT
jgi:hypothetical protein